MSQLLPENSYFEKAWAGLLVLVFLLPALSIGQGSNSSPQAQNDTVLTSEDNAIVIAVLQNDSDPDGDPLTVSIIASAFAGTTTVLNGDSILFTPAANFTGSVSFKYQVCDGSGACDTATVFITVVAGNDPPTARPDSASTLEETAVIIDVQFNDSDPDNDPLLTTIVQQPNDGTAIVQNGDSISYDPNAQFTGQDTFYYQVCDPGGLCDTAQVIVTVIRVNDPPLAVNDADITFEETPIVIDVQANDSDPDDTSAVFTTRITSPPANGTVTVLNGDSVNYSPDINYNGTDIFFYRICDGDGGCDTAMVSITVVPQNDKPTANDDYRSIPEDDSTVIDVQANDNDIDGDPLVTTIVQQPANGSAVTVNNDSISYAPNINYFGNDTIIYRICDTGGACDTAVVYLTMTPQPDKPLAVDDFAVTREDSAIVVDVQANDSDPDGDELYTTYLNQPANGSAQVLGLDSIRYTPNPNFTGTDSFNYQVCDNSGLCDTATVTITVNPEDDAPIARNDFAVTNENTTVVVDVQVNDTEPDGEPLTTTITNAPNNGSAIVLNGDSISYSPNTGFTGVDTLFYQVCDPGGLCDTARLRIRVSNINQAPIATTDFDTTDINTAVSVEVLANDFDPDGDSLSVQLLSNPANGSAVVLANNNIRYTPNQNFVGVDTISYQSCDGGGLCDNALVIIAVIDLNLIPIAADDFATTIEDQPVVVQVLNNDIDLDLDNLSVTAVSTPSNGSVSILNADSIRYTPAPNFNGNDSFLYQVCDGNGGCDTAEVFITINAINDAPNAQDDLNITTPEDVAVTIDVQANDSDPDGDPLTTSIADPPQNGSAAVLNGDSILYTPNTNFTGKDTLLYAVCDNTGLCDTATVVIDVLPLNDTPLARNDTVSTNEDVSITFSVLGNDSDPDGDPLTAILAQNPSHGSATVLSGDSIRYTPNLNFNGLDSLQYEACDGNGACDLAWVIITVIPVNDQPVARRDSTSTPEDQAVVIDVQQNDLNPDGGVLTTSVVNQPANGSASVLNGDSIQYVPNTNFNGLDTLLYSIAEANGNTDQALVIINVLSVPDAPIARTDRDTTLEDVATVVKVQANDSDIDGFGLSVSMAQGFSNGAATVLNGDSIQYQPNTNFNGNDTAIYRLCDNAGLCDTARLIITVLPVNDGPQAANDTATTLEDNPVTIGVLANDFDPDGDPLTITILAAAQNGIATVQNDSILYVPATNFNGLDSAQYRICDASGLCDSAWVLIDVIAVNDAPVAVNDAETTFENTSVLVDVQANDFDPEGDALTTVWTNQPTNGTVSIVAGNQVNYFPNTGFTGTDQFRYAISDGKGGTDTAQVQIIITQGNLPPVAFNDSVITVINTPVSIAALNNDTDPDPDTLAITSIVQAPQNGAGAISTSTLINYTPNNNFIGTDSLLYEVCDGNGGCDEAWIFISVKDTLQNVLPPNAINDFASVDANQSIMVPVLVNDSDPQNFSLSIQGIVEPAQHGTATVVNDSVNYTPNLGFVGSDSLRYAVCNSAGLCDTATVFIGVNPTDIEIEIPNGITPNGDGFNDEFVILNLDRHPNNSFKVFNRWGTEVYSQEQYFDQWHGQSNSGGTLPNGTYYYILKINDLNQEYSGYIDLRRRSY